MIAPLGSTPGTRLGSRQNKQQGGRQKVCLKESKELGKNRQGTRQESMLKSKQGTRKKVCRKNYARKLAFN